MEQQSQVFDDIEQYHQHASTGARFANYLVDMILFYGFLIAFIMVLEMVLALAGLGGQLSIFITTLEGRVFSYLVAFSMLILFFTLVEGFSKGRSVGKLLTGTKAIREDGQPITWKDALLRSLCRLIPFEALSGISGHPWHDGITKTMVVKK